MTKALGVSLAYWGGRTETERKKNSLSQLNGEEMRAKRANFADAYLQAEALDDPGRDNVCLRGREEEADQLSFEVRHPLDLLHHLLVEVLDHQRNRDDEIRSVRAQVVPEVGDVRVPW